jgi:hypothetical protein
MDNKLFKEILQEIPGSFKAKLERIRRYLYLDKVSVMIGAGFSCNANVPSHIKIKKWDDVGGDIYCSLQAVDKVDPSKLVFKTPMRLASQYAATNGRSELDNLIRDSIPDDQMTPGSLHRQLLSLPWRDVFTTNYDTLLERSRDEVERSYSVVTSKEMLLYKHSPRIIKLHGSFPDKTPFLMTEEDYRTYPEKHPEFVNTVRQALVESIFCLIGFSGDDPNFISWQGWLRDVMGDYAGPSYLITCDEEYDESFKILMEHRGIEVLNFYEIRGLNDYKLALDFFFTYLSERESEWNGYYSYSSDGSISAIDLTQRLKEIRLSYPGWFILPSNHYDDFRDINFIFPNLDNLYSTLIERKDKENFLYELDWRADISLSFKDIEWYRMSIESLISSYENEPLSSEAISLGISLLRLYRHHFDKKNESDNLKQRLIKETSRMTQYQISLLYYTIACNALSLLDYDTVESTLKEWKPTSSDYEGIIFKSLVLAESTDRAAAMDLLNDAFDRITQSLTQNTTQEEKSLRCVIEGLLAFYNREQIPKTDTRFSFIELSHFIQRQIDKVNKKAFEIIHGFGVGATNRSWNLGSGIKPEFLYPYRYLLLCERYGFPYGMVTNTVDEKLLSSIVVSVADYGMPYSLGPVLRSGSREVVLSFANRLFIKELTKEQGDGIATLLLAVSQQNSCEKARSYRNVNVLLPFLARLSTICSVGIVIDICRFALSTFKDSLFCKAEDLNIIYANVMPEGIQSICSEAFSKEIYSGIGEQDYPLPYLGLKHYSPGDKEIKIVCDGLLSSEEKTKHSAYQRAKRLLKTNISEERKKIIYENIRIWRSRETSNDFTRISYIDVPPDEREQNILLRQTEQDLELFLSKDYTYDGSSLAISSLEANIRNLSIESDYLTENQICNMFDKLSVILDDNYLYYSRDDSNEFLGGLRRFTKSLFYTIGEFVKVVINNNFVNKQSCTKLFKALLKYTECHLPVRITLDRLNQIARVIGLNKMRDIIVDKIFSDNELDVIDSCDGLISYIYHGNGYQKVLQSMIFYSIYAGSDMIRLYLQTLSMIPVEKMTKTTQNHLARMMELIIQRIPKQGLSEEQKVDIMHDGVRLAASLKHITNSSSIMDAVRLWEEYANSDNFNDVRLPWFLND